MCYLKQILGTFIILGLSISPVSAQIPTVPVAFPSNYSCTPGQLLFRQAGMERMTIIGYHNGHVYTTNIAGNLPREFQFADITDPASFEQVFTPGLRSMTDSLSHGYTKSGDYMAGYFTMGYGYVSEGVNAVEFDPPGWVSWQLQPPAPDSGANRIYYPWSVPFNWQQYGPSSGTARLYRAGELLSQWEPLADNSIAGNSILLGNMLFMTSDASMLGVAAYDISPVFDTPPGPPLLVDRLTGAVGSYLGSIWQDYLVLAGGIDRDQLFIVDISDPTNMRLIQTFNLAGTPELNAGTNVPYVQTQDNFIFVRRHKIDMEQLQIVLEFDEVGDNRPAGSVGGMIDVSQYNLPLGNLMISGSYTTAGRDAIGVWCHQAEPDTRPPYVGYHIPRDGQINYPLGAPISLVIAEELESFTIVNGESFIVRPIGGNAIDSAWTSFSHDGVLTYTPTDYLLPDTSYEVIIPAGGIKDIAGNGIEGYSFTFSTGSAVGGGNAAPDINSVTSSASPSAPGESVTITTDAVDNEMDTLEYRFVYGDGTAATDWQASPSVNHVFNQVGHYNIKAQVRDIKPDMTSSVVSDTYIQTVVILPGGPLPVSSSMLSLDDSNRVMWVVNPDNDSVSRMDVDGASLIEEIDLRAITGLNQSINPVSVAVDASGRAWIAARDANRLIVLNSAGDLVSQIDTGYGSSPQAILISRDATRAFLTLGGRGNSDAGNGQLVRYSISTISETGRLELGKLPRAMALSGSGDQLFVASFLSGLQRGTIWNINPIAMSLTGEIVLPRDRGIRGLDFGGSDGPGVPNYIADLVITPDHQWLWYTAIKTDTNRGEYFAQGTELNLPSSPDSSLRSLLGRVDLTVTPPLEPEAVPFTTAVSRVDIDNSDSPSSISFSPAGDYAFVTLQGNDTLTVFDDFAIRAEGGASTIWRTETGFAPQASVLDAATNQLWVKNFMSRDLTIVELNPFISTGSIQLNKTSVSSVQTESLSNEILQGKRSFYFAGNDPLGANDMSFEGYISCASCHIDGAHDGRTWDFTQRGEGFRNTTDLRGRRGMGHGNVHWTANFDEIQDFVLDMVNHFGGTGFLDSGEQANSSLGAPNGNLHAELDQLSAYVSSLNADTIPQSPYRSEDGTLSAAALAGQGVFNSNACASCHNPQSDFTNSQLGASPSLQNVGTIRSSSGQRLGGALTGIDTPTLLGVWETAPYFHDGSARSLEDVFVIAGGINIQAELAVLSAGASIPNFIDINYDSSAYGNMVMFPNNSAATLSLSAIDGGSGGVGAIEIRILPRSFNQSTQVNLTVNGNPNTIVISPAGTHLDWKTVRVEGVNLSAGSTNTVSLSLSGAPGIFVDEFLITRSDDLALAMPHRRIQSLSGANRSDLMTYLRELDGRDTSFIGDGIFENGFE